MQRSLHDTWWRLATQPQPTTSSETLLCQFLQAGAVLYGGVVALRNTAYDRHWLRSVRLPHPVISVGNLTVGGTGKTTCVEWLVRKLQRLNRRPVILSRGYGGARREYWLRMDDGRLTVNGHPAGTADGLADEPQLLAQHLAGVSVFVGSQRARTGSIACRQAACDTVVLDDGFQHRQLQRDCEIVLISAVMPREGWALLPRGPMREPLTSLKRAHVIMITKADEAPQAVPDLLEHMHAMNPRATLMTAAHTPWSLIDLRSGHHEDPTALASRRVGVLSSLGDPRSVEVTVCQLGATMLWHETFPDHHRYQPKDWTAVVAKAAATQPDVVVTTEKDWVRLRPIVATATAATLPLRVLTIRMHVLSGEQALDDRLARVSAR